MSELVDRACKPLGDLPFARGFQGTANVSGGSNDSCLVRVTRGLDCLVGGGPGRVDRCLVSRARDTETHDRNCYGASHAYESRGGTNERCLDDRIHAVMLRGQRHRIERGRRAGGSDRASLTLRPGSGRSKVTGYMGRAANAVLTTVVDVWGRSWTPRCLSRSSGLIRWTVVDSCGRGRSPENRTAA